MKKLRLIQWRVKRVLKLNINCIVRCFIKFLEVATDQLLYKFYPRSTKTEQRQLKK